MHNYPYIFLVATHKEDAQRVKESFEKAGITAEIRTLTRSGKERKKEQPGPPLCRIEYLSSLADQCGHKKKCEEFVPTDIPLVRVVSREIEQKEIPYPKNWIVFREPRKKQGWKNLASYINLVIWQQKEIRRIGESELNRADLVSEEIQRLIFDSLNAGIIHIDTEGKIIDASTWVIDKFSGSTKKGKIIGQELAKSEIGRSLGLDWFIPELLLGHEVTEPDCRVRRGGYEKTARLSIRGKPLFGPNGEVTGALIIIEDLEETPETLQKLVRLQSLDTAGSLTGSLATELTKMLSIIRDHTKYLTSRIGEPEPVSGDLIAIENASEIAVELIQRLTSVTSVGISGCSLVDINQAIRDVTTILNRVSDQSIAFLLELEPRLKSISADKVLIHLMLINLINNANEAMPMGGIIRIRTGAIQGDNLEAAGLKHTPNGAIWFSVHDNGVGMTPETKAKAFQAFFSTKNAVRHAGLGLTVVQKAVRENNGTINIESQPGRGCTVSLYFPVASAVSDSPQNIDSSLPEFKRLVLLADGEQVVRTMSRELLETGGYRVISVSNGKETIELFHEHRLDVAVVVVDTALPDKSWEDVVEALRSINPEAKVLLTSGNTTETNIKEALTSYQVGFLQKPFRMDTLLEKVREVQKVDKAIV